jgi:hypothetical protein
VALEPIEPDEGVITLDGAQPVAVLARAIVTDVRIADTNRRRYRQQVDWDYKRRGSKRRGPLPLRVVIGT